MAVAANTYLTYDMVGKREDLSDKIWDVSPTETPLTSSIGKNKASNHLHEWQTYVLRTSGDNAHLEGDDFTPQSRTPTVRLGNYTQNFVNVISISGSDMGLDKAGRGKEMDRESALEAKAQKLDIERAFFQNQARVAGSAGVAPRLAGLPSWLATNTAAGNIGSGGSNPTGDGTDARTDGTQTAFSQTKFDLAMQTAWDNGGKPSICVLSSFQAGVARNFVGNNNQRNTVEAGTVRDVIDVYATQWGQVEFVMSRECRARDVFIVDPEYWKVSVKRGTSRRDVPALGDYERKAIVTELTLESCNERASVIIPDNSTS